MSFEIFTPRQRGSSLQVGEAVMQATGLTRFHPADLAAAEIGRHCVILTDAATQRLAIRAPREEEKGMLEPTATVRRGKSGRSAHVGLRGAAAQAGIALEGLRRFRVDRKEGLLILSASENGAAPRGRKGRAK